MSHVTGVILTISLLEEGEYDGDFPAIDAVNAWLGLRAHGEIKRVDFFSGGKKAMQAAVFMGAFNYLNIKEFLSAVADAPWVNRDGLAIFVKDEHDERFFDMSQDKDLFCASV